MDMLFDYAYIAVPLILCVFAVLLLKKKGSKKIQSATYYIKRGDPTAQTDYDSKNKNPNPLTKDEKIELSWEFLYEITDIVLSKFSQEDKEQITKIGHQMIDGGAGYEHVIEYGLKPQKKHTQLIEEEKSQDVELKR